MKRQDPFVKTNGEIDWPAYYRHWRAQTARNFTDANGKHPFVKANGEIDWPAYYRHWRAQAARNYTDANGKHPFVKANGEIDWPKYQRHVREQTARNYKDEDGKHPFVKANGELDWPKYQRHVREQKARNYTDEDGKHPFVKANGELDWPAYYQHIALQMARKYRETTDNDPFFVQRTSGQKIQIPPEEMRIIGAYMLIAQLDGSHTKRSGQTVIWDASLLRYLAMWLNRMKQNHAYVPYGLNSLQKLGSHRKDEEVEKMLESFRQVADTPPSVKTGIKSIIDVLRWIWHRMEAQLEKEKQAVEDRDTAQFAAALEAELPLSPHHPHDAAMTDAALFEEALAQPPQPVPASSGRQADVMVGHSTQTGEVDAAAMEEQAAFSELDWDIPFDPLEMSMTFQDLEKQLTGEVDAAAMEEQADFSELEWDIPFDPPEMGMAFQDLENMPIDDDFFDFTFDDEADDGFEEESGFGLGH